MNKITVVSQKHPLFLFIKPIVTIIFLLLGHYYVIAQPSNRALFANASPTAAHSTTWNFLSGTKKIYFIDFDEVQEKVEIIQVKSITGDIIFEDNVTDLSRKTFYELNLTKIENGEYYLEILAKHKTLRKLLKLE